MFRRCFALVFGTTTIMVPGVTNHIVFAAWLAVGVSSCITAGGFRAALSVIATCTSITTDGASAWYGMGGTKERFLSQVEQCKECWACQFDDDDAIYYVMYTSENISTYVSYRFIGKERDGTKDDGGDLHVGELV